MSQMTLLFTEEERKRAESKAETTLRLLQRGPMSRSELIEQVSHRFSASIRLLREQGYQIDMSEDCEVYTLSSVALKTKVTDQIQDLYYTTQHWSEKRLERMRLDGFRCCHCRSTETLQVHHWVYDLFSECLEDLTTLCESCHTRIHETENVLVHFPRYLDQSIVSLMRETQREVQWDAEVPQ